MARASTFQHSLISFLKKPLSYPHQPKSIEIVETHASILALAPPFVYKFKKQLDFGFMDFRSLEARRKNCERELKLNRRLCNKIYLEVLPLYEQDAQLYFGHEASEGRIVDYALKMKQLPEGYFFQQYLAKEQLNTIHLEKALQHLQGLYEQAVRNPDIAHYGELSQLRENSDENFKSLRGMKEKLFASEALQAIEAATSHFLQSQQALFARRVAEDRIKDCHGDLRLEHIHLKDDEVCIFDCIEFNERFRYIDIAADIAFLSMDLDFSESPALAAFVSRRMAALLKDPDMLRLLPFYMVYRACVRAKVEGIRAGQPEISLSEKKEHQEKAQKYLQLALKYSVLGDTPRVIVICGRIGSGKSTLAGKLAAFLDLPYRSSDKIRKGSTGEDLHKRTEEEKKAWLYSKEKTDEVYGQLLKQALEHVKAYRSIVLDATFGKQKQREGLMIALQQQEASFFFVEATATEAMLKKRLRQRDHQYQTSDARLEDFDALNSAFEPLLEIPAHHYIRVDTETPVTESIASLMKALPGLEHIRA